MNISAIIMIVFTILLFMILPLLVTKKVNFLLLLIEVFLTISCCESIYYVTHIDKVHARFYKGASDFTFPEPDRLGKVGNVALGLSTGIAVFFLYRFILTSFDPFLGKAINIIAVLFGLSIALILIAQYKKRLIA